MFFVIFIFYCFSDVIENENDEFEMKEFFGRYTMDVIATCAFGVKCDSLKDPNDEFIKLAVKFNDIPLHRRILLLISILITPKLLKWFPITPFNDKVIYSDLLYNCLNILITIYVLY